MKSIAFVCSLLVVFGVNGILDVGQVQKNQEVIAQTTTQPKEQLVVGEVKVENDFVKKEKTVKQVSNKNVQSNKQTQEKTTKVKYCPNNHENCTKQECLKQCIHETCNNRCLEQQKKHTTQHNNSRQTPKGQGHHNQGKGKHHSK